MSRSCKMKIIFLVVVVLISYASSYQMGAPTRACTHMTPGHGGSPQTSNLPYSVELDVTSVKSGDSVSITVKQMAGANPFEGLLVVARDESDNSVVGKFVNIGTGLMAINCEGQTDSGLTHSSNDKRSEITLTWQHPVFKEGSDKTIAFYYTIVKGFTTYWVKNKHPTNLIVKANPEGTVEPTADLHEDYKGCLESKGCFGIGPENCVKDGKCQVLATYMPDGDNFKFILHGRDIPNGNYLAVGFSDDKDMGSDMVFACKVGETSSDLMVATWNEDSGKNNLMGLTQVTFTNTEFSSTDGTSTCKFTVPKKLTVTPPNGDPAKDYDLGESKYHLLLATGPMDTEKLLRHEDRQASESPVSLKDFSKVEGGSDKTLRAHGALMILAWIASASSGMFFARYMKETWKNKKLMGKDIWYPVHTGSMFLTFILTVIAFIIILVEEGNLFIWEEIKENPHPALGLTTVLLTFINPMMAVFRPHPQDKYRWVFNWAHWFVGNSAWILGMITIFLAGSLHEADFIPSEKFFYMVLGFVIVHFIFHMAFSGQRYWALSNSEVEHMDNVPERGALSSNEEMKSVSSSSSRDLRGATLRKVGAIVYVTFAWVYGLVLAFHVGLGKKGAQDTGNWFGDADDEAEAES